jgi:muramoyltetrapeptide carboxypeptidase
MSTLPKRLNCGDTLGLIAPASPPSNSESVDACAQTLEKMGFEVALGKHVRERKGFLAGEDRDRAGDLMQMFTDKKIHGIVCLRGGYGTPRLLPLLDYPAIRRHPKVFVGYSDITALNCALLHKSNLVTFHGPGASSFTAADCPAFSRQSWLNAIMQPQPPGSICAGCPDQNVTILQRGKVSGRLVGGNLSLLVSLIGTPFLPSLKNKILFFEDVDERPYRMDRMLTQFLNAGLLQQVAGIAVGNCKGCDETKPAAPGDFRQTLKDVLMDRLLPLKVPVVMGLPFGHVPFNATLPFGVEATLDAINGDLIITKAGVK